MNGKELAGVLYKSKYTVCISGREMIVEDGIDSMRNLETAYEIETKYGYSPEEVFSARFFNTRTEQFYEFYREEVLAQDKEPGPAYQALAKMEELGVLQCTITRQLFDFPRRVGCHHVYNLHGNIFERNACPRCGKLYSMEYLRDSGKVPLCEKCRVPVHPGVTLLGEMVDIGLMTKAADEVAKADTLLLAGTNLWTETVQQFLKYFHGTNIVLIHDGHHFADKDADIFLSGKCSEILPETAKELERLKKTEAAKAENMEKGEAVEKAMRPGRKADCMES